MRISDCKFSDRESIFLDIAISKHKKHKPYQKIVTGFSFSCFFKNYTTSATGGGAHGDNDTFFCFTSLNTCMSSVLNRRQTRSIRARFSRLLENLLEKKTNSETAPNRSATTARTWNWNGMSILSVKLLLRTQRKNSHSIYFAPCIFESHFTDTHRPTIPHLFFKN